MSGGYWNYQNDYLCGEILGIGADYVLDSKEHKEDILQIRKLNLLEDRVISEIAYDVFCLLHSYDWYRSGDTCEETYRKDVETFKKKWLKQKNLLRMSLSHLKMI